LSPHIKGQLPHHNRGVRARKALTIFTSGINFC
jgi:hypothetical protein